MCAEAGPWARGEGRDNEAKVGQRPRHASCASQVRATRTPKCPVCRHGLTEIAIRALSAEQSIAVLPAKCRYCHGGMPRGSLGPHEAACPRAPVPCVAAKVGCMWTGLRGVREAHEATCVRGEAHNAGAATN
jgi:hypothetical protein